MANDSSDRDFIAFKRLFREIQLQADVGYKLHKSKRSDWDYQFFAVFKELTIVIVPIQEYQETLAKGCAAFDFIGADGVRVKGNGFRSLLMVLQKLLERALESLQKCSRERGGVFYSATDHLSILTAMTRALQGMELMTENAIKLMNANTPPVLMNDGEVTESLMVLACTEDVSRDAFYGRCLGFQYSQSLKPILQFLAISMASYEEWHSSNKEDPVKQLLNSIWKGSKYLQHPTQRGVKIAQVTDNPNIYFAKAFWSLTEREAIKAVVKFVSQNVDISKSIEVPAKNILVKNLAGDDVTVTPPFSDIGYKPVTATLISFKWRTGQPSPSYGRKPNPLQPSKTLMFHLHGGGFVAQSSKSHESYLRWWSKELDCPIISVDYSLAPEAPFPRALEECVFVYAWALNNFETLGTTGEKIIFVGDSAGGNLVLTTAMKLKSLGLRLPHHIFSYYPATIVRSCATPSRFLSVIDPLLPCGIMISCLQAYTGKVPDEAELQRRNEIRRKLLLAKGYIIPSTENTSQQNSGLSKYVGKQRSKTISSKPSESTGGAKPRPPPPSRPPLPKSLSVESSVGGAKPKPQRPPPPRPTKTHSEGVSFSSLAASSIDPIADEDVTKQSKDSSSNDNESTTSTISESSDKPTDQVLTTETKFTIEPATDKEDIGLTEVDLLTSSEPTPEGEGQGEEQKGEDGDVLSPLQSGPLPLGSSDVTTPTSKPPGPPAPLNPMSSVAAFFPPQSDSGEEDSDVRLGHRIPSPEETLTQQEIDTLVRELLDSYKDSDITKDPFMSPALASDDLLQGLPPVDVIACSLDPLLDDGITFAQRLKALDQPVTLTVLDGISHGFLSLTGADNVVQAQLKCTRLMKAVM